MWLAFPQVYCYGLPAQQAAVQQLLKAGGVSSWKLPPGRAGGMAELMMSCAYITGGAQLCVEVIDAMFP